jgi:hypothetical protein
MTERFVCPGCGRWLRVPAGCTEPRLSCPHCLAEVANLAAPQGIQAGPPAAAPASSSAIQAPARWGAGAALDVDVRRDQRGTGCGIILLAILGILGLAYGLTGTAVALHEGLAWPLLTLLVVVVVAAGISALRVYRRPQHPMGAQGAFRVVLNTLALLGGVVAAGVLLAVAAFIIFFFICLSEFRNARF